MPYEYSVTALACSIRSGHMFLTISEDLYVTAHEAAQGLLHVALTLFGLQGGTDALLGSLHHQHGGLHCSQTRVHQLSLGNVTTGEASVRTAGGDRGSLNNDTLTQILLTCESQRDVCTCSDEGIHSVLCGGTAALQHKRRKSDRVLTTVTSQTIKTLENSKH